MDPDKPARRAIADSVVKRLYALSRNQCAFPQCATRLTDHVAEGEPPTNVGEIAHIVAASRQGPRGQLQDLSDVNAIDNLILVCSLHHKQIDDHAFNSADQITSAGSTTYQYDSHGSRIKTTAGSTITNYGYDQADRLCWAGPTSTGAPCTATVQTSDTAYCYDAGGLRMTKVTAGTCAAPTTSEAFTWDVSSSLPLMLTDGATDYVYGPGGLPLEQISGSSTLWFHHDQIGSTRAITDNTGATKATYVFDPYGNVVSCTGATVAIAGVNKCTGTIVVTNPLLFGAQYRDPEANSYYLHARYYDPLTAQFISRDPMVATTLSAYGYVAGNPLNRTDTSGLGWCKDQTGATGTSCSTLTGSAYTGPTKNCVVIGGNESSADSVEVEASVSCNVLASQGSNGPTYSAWDPSQEGALSPGEACKSDPASGYSHCSSDGNRGYIQSCLSLVVIQPCISMDDNGQLYGSIGFGFGGPGIGASLCVGEANDAGQLLNGGSVSAGGFYGVGGGYSESTNFSSGGIYVGIGLKGAGMFVSVSGRLP